MESNGAIVWSWKHRDGDWMRVWVGKKGEFGIKDDPLVWANVPGCGMAAFSKVEETKKEKDLVVKQKKEVEEVSD